MLNLQTLLKASRILLYSTAVLPLVLWAGFTFPYVTIRTVAFRISIEIAAVLVLLLWVQGRVRFAHLRTQWFFWIFAGLLAVESIAALFGEAPLASFFGDLERMWGIFTVLHLFLFYILVRIFFHERQWRTFFHVSFVTSIGVSVYGILQRNPDLFGIYLFGAGEGTRIVSTLGNPVYVAIYLLFNIAFALYLLMRTPRGSLWYFYLSVIAIDFYAFTLTDIRGAYLGLLVGVAAAGLGYVFLGSRKRAKQTIAASFVLGIIILSLGFQFRRSEAVRSIPVLRRVVTISINDSTSQTRFIGWNAAWKGFLEDPLTGAGMENYNIAFNKHFPARYYLLAPTETYFDRAHNQFFNILAESGIIALLLYLAFPVFIGYYLIAGYRRERFALGEFLLFGGLSIAYFTHLFFVFDDFHSLLLFAAFLALIEFRYHGTAVNVFASPEQERPRSKALPAIALILVVGAVLYSFWGLNAKTIIAAKNTGAAFLTEDIGESLAYYRRAVAIGLIPSENVTLNFVDYLMGLSEKNDEIAGDAKLKADVLAAFAEAERALFREIKKKPNDAVYYLKLGQLNNTWFLLDDDAAHLADAIGYLERAAELSPGRIQMYLVLGESYVLAGESAKAIEILTRAVNLEPSFGSTYYYLGRALLTDGQLDAAYDAIVNKSFVEYRRQPEVLTIAFILAEELAATGEYQRMVVVYEHLARFKPRDARVHSALAAGYVLADRLEDAIGAAQKAAELDPGFAPEAAAFIQAILDGRADELKQSLF